MIFQLFDKYISITQNASEISDVFDEFSRKYDDLIFNIANEYLQIKKSNKQNGLFDFDFYEEEIKHILINAKHYVENGKHFKKELKEKK